MRVPNQTLSLTKTAAARRQVEAAIQALVRGDFDAAVTLAGAADGLIKRDGMTLYNFMMNHPLVREIPPTDLHRHLNQVRDWLKHSDRGPDVQAIGRRDAAEMITRAASKLEAADWTPAIDDFRSWFITNVEEIFKEE